MPEIPPAVNIYPNPHLDKFEDHVAIARATASAVGADPDAIEATLRAVPVYDVPARQDVPKPTPRRRGVAVEYRTDGHLSIGGRELRLESFELATRWSITPSGDLRVYDGPTELAAFSGNVWETVRWAEDIATTTTGADA